MPTGEFDYDVLLSGCVVRAVVSMDRTAVQPFREKENRYGLKARPQSLRSPTSRTTSLPFELWLPDRPVPRRRDSVL